MTPFLLKAGAAAFVFCALCGRGAASIAADAAPAACSQPQYRQFDFWVGRWTVYDRKTNGLAGHNTITKAYGGCVVQEHWTDADGSTGSSFNIYDDRRRRWHQTWVDSRGQLLLLNGGLIGNEMVLSGPAISRRGKSYLNRITWTPLAGGSVRQHWEFSLNAGRTWRDVFDGIYRHS